MQRTILVLVLLLMLAACTDATPPLPTAVPTLAPEQNTEASSPRITATPKFQVPPTWTPASPLAEPTSPPATGAEETTGGSATSPARNGETYVVQAGDTLAEIAAAYGLDLDQLAAANGIDNIDHIEVGQELIIPNQ